MANSTRELPPSPDDGGFVRIGYDGSASPTVSVKNHSGALAVGNG